MSSDRPHRSRCKVHSTFYFPLWKCKLSFSPAANTVRFRGAILASRPEAEIVSLNRPVATSTKLHRPTLAGRTQTGLAV
jgi:hypothetical protein